MEWVVNNNQIWSGMGDYGNSEPWHMSMKELYTTELKEVYTTELWTEWMTIEIHRFAIISQKSIK